MQWLRTWLFLLLIGYSCAALAAPPTLEPKDVTIKVKEILKRHACYKTLDTSLVKRALQSYAELLDPAKVYLLHGEIEAWLNPSEEMLNAVLKGYETQDFSAFEAINGAMLQAIERRNNIENEFSMQSLPTDVHLEEFKELPWAEDEAALRNRLLRLKSLQLSFSQKVANESSEQVLQRMSKRRLHREEELVGKTLQERKQTMLANILKATAASLDSHTAYLTPDEASDFMMQIQQKLSGIGVHLRDDFAGVRIVALIEGGPAEKSGHLHKNDLIIAVNGESIIGEDLAVTAQKIRGGPEGSSVKLTILREVNKESEERLEIEVIRGEVVLKEARLETSQEPYGDGIIGRIALHSFYQDGKNSSASDIKEAIERMARETNLKGLILDLRSNGGGLLSQAIEVTGLFIGKGIVASVKDHRGMVQHLRNLTTQIAWDGPMIVLVSRLSASCSEIVAQALQDYGRTIIIGDETTYGKGTFQGSTFEALFPSSVNPKGELKVTGGIYYTVSGNSPQLTGVRSHIVVPGPLAKAELGERFSKFPLQPDQIQENFHDSLSDIPFLERAYFKENYLFDLQPRLTKYVRFLDILRANSQKRIAQDRDYQAFLQAIESDDAFDELTVENDLQIIEANNIMKDLIYLGETYKEAA